MCVKKSGGALRHTQHAFGYCISAYLISYAVIFIHMCGACNVYNIMCTIPGIFYYMLLNIDPKYRSSLHSIQLATVCCTELIEKYAVSEVLAPFMSSIKSLESVSCYFAHTCL